MVEIDKETNELGFRVVGCAYKVHTTIGPGLLESVYEACLCHELEKENIPFEKQKALPVIYDNQKLDCGYRIDILVANKIILELKTVEAIQPVHTAQLMTYLRLSNLHLGYIINFYTTSLKNGIRRYVL